MGTRMPRRKMLKLENPANVLTLACRVCSQVICLDQAVSLFSSIDTKDGDTIVKTIVDVMREFANVTVLLNDDRPKHICSSCLCALEGGIHLQQQIRANELTAVAIDDAGIANDLKLGEDDYEFEYLDEFRDEIECGTGVTIELGKPDSTNDAAQVELHTPEEDEMQGKELTIQLTEEETEYLQDSLLERGKFAFEMPPAELIAQQLSFDKLDYLEIRGERCCGCAHIAPSRDALMAHAKEMHSQNYYADSSYTCPTCYQKFPTAETLQKHTQYYSYSDIFLCKICKEAFNFRSHVMLHLQDHEQPAEEDGYESESTKKKSRRKDVAQRLEISDEKVIKETLEFPQYRQHFVEGERCCACGLYMESIQQHVAVEHQSTESGSGGLRCAVCQRTFASRRLLVLHEQERRKSCHLYECRLCCRLFAKRFHVMKHLQKKMEHSAEHDNAACATNAELPAVSTEQSLGTGSKEMDCFCCCFRRCKDEFATEAELLDHAEETHGGRKKENEIKLTETADVTPEHVCPICLLLFESVEKLQQHRLYKMHMEKQHCHLCGRTFMRKSGLREHQEREHLDLPPRFACEICGKSFITRSTLNQHRRVHGPFEGCPCIAEGCDVVFRDKHLMQRHYRNVHTENKPYACRHCQKVYRTKESLDIHERCHTGERPFACRHEGCSKRYAHGTDRLRHERSAHTGERPHKCSVCSSSFFRKRELRMHAKKQHNEV